MFIFFTHDIECGNGKYGSNCLLNCGHCKKMSDCNHVDGSCMSGCFPGYNGSRCIDRKHNS